MPPPLFRLGQNVKVKNPVPARRCLMKGYKKISLPPGSYTIAEILRNEEYAHVAEMSDGYTYRLNTNFGGVNIRVSIWQNDLIEGTDG